MDDYLDDFQELESEYMDDFPSMEPFISQLLLTMGVPTYLLGAGYLKDAVFMAVKDEAILGGMTKALYPAIALKNKTKAARVERAMRNALDAAWNKNKPEAFHAFFGFSSSDSRRPTNRQFVSVLAEIIRIENSFREGKGSRLC